MKINRKEIWGIDEELNHRISLWCLKNGKNGKPVASKDWARMAQEALEKLSTQ